MAEVKNRLLVLLQYLYENTDDEHPATLTDLAMCYKQNGHAGNRHTITDDIQTAIAFGVEILSVSVGHAKGYYIAERLFEFIELKMLADAVSSSKVINLDKSTIILG